MLWISRFFEDLANFGHCKGCAGGLAMRQKDFDALVLYLVQVRMTAMANWGNGAI